MTDITDLPSLYSVTGDIKDINTLLISRDALRELLRESLEALTCGDTGDALEDSHRCGRCDEYVDRNAKLRTKIRAALAQGQENKA